MEDSALLELEHVSVTLQGVRALSDVSLALRQGEHCALLGPNGAGKSTLLKVLRAECFPDDGEIAWYPHGFPEKAPLAGREMCALVSVARTELYLRQQWRISGEELIVSGLYDTPLLYQPADGREKEEARLLAEGLGLTQLLAADITTLSQVQLSMLLFARACIRRPQILLLDEFIDGLDAGRRAILLAALEELSLSATLLVATHRPENLPSCIHKIMRMDEGKITTVEAFSGLPAVSLEARRDEDRMEVNRASHKVFSLSDVTVHIGGTPALRGLNWDVREDEHWMLTGGAGAGKSTLLRLLAGEYYPAEGGEILRILPGAATPLLSLSEIRKHIRLVSGDMQATYSYNLSGEEFVCSGLEGSIGIYRELSEEEREEARSRLEEVDALHLAVRAIRSLSTGQLRRLLLARALIGAPSILLLDDPFAGLDAASRTRVRELLSLLVAKRGIQTVMTCPSNYDLLPQTLYTATMVDGRLILPVGKD